MKLIANLREIDRQATLQAGIPAERLMENAGNQIANTLRQTCQPAQSGVILCGPGNNGGDGFVCARLLLRQGFQHVTVIYTGKQYLREALTNLEQLMTLPLSLIDATTQPELALRKIEQADFIVDALFGSGLSRDITGLASDLVTAVNHRHAQGDCHVLAVDIPSGIDGATGQVRGCAIMANATVTFAAAKPGLYLYPGKAHAGRVSVADIGIPQALIEADPSPARLMSLGPIRTMLPPRPADSHKYHYGHLLVIAGSHHMPGAAILCAEAAMSSGAGLVTLAAPAGVFAQVPLMPEIIRLPLPDPEHLGGNSLPVLQEALARGKYTAVVIGPGLDQAAETFHTVIELLRLLRTLELPVVVDADGLNALAAGADPDFTLNERFILTPHGGECARLLRADATTISADLLCAAAQTRERFEANVILKSATTIIATMDRDSDGLSWISPWGNAGMATAGSGDVLTGIVGAIAAQTAARTKMHPASDRTAALQAALLGVSLHGLAGDAAARTRTRHAMRASDITGHLPDAFKVLLQSTE